MSNENFSPSVVGLRQVLKALKNGSLAMVLLATDADEHYKQTVLAAAKEANVKVVSHQTSDAIAKLYGVEVKSAVAGILKG